MTDQPASSDAARDAARKEALYAGFLLALRVYEAVHRPDAPDTEQAAVWDRLREIAAGRETIVPSAAEIVRDAPDAATELVDAVWAHINKFVASDREVAAAVLAQRDALWEDVDRQLGGPPSA